MFAALPSSTGTKTIPPGHARLRGRTALIWSRPWSLGAAPAHGMRVPTPPSLRSSPGAHRWFRKPSPTGIRYTWHRVYLREFPTRGLGRPRVGLDRAPMA